MCCGKGGDLLKWKNNDVKHVICVDVAKISVEQCEQRYNEMKERTFNSKHKNIFSAEFIVADCTKVSIYFGAYILNYYCEYYFPVYLLMSYKFLLY